MDSCYLSPQILTVLKIIFLMQTFLSFILTDRECPSENLTGLRYRCKLIIDFDSGKFECYTPIEDEYKDVQFSMPFIVENSTIEMNQDLMHELKTAFVEKYTNLYTNFSWCERDSEKNKTLDISEARRLCSMGYECYNLFPNIFENQFVKAIEIFNKNAIKFGNLTGLVNLFMIGVTKTQEIAFEERATAGIPAFEALFMIRNNLTHIPSNSLVGNTKLKTLCLSDNLITKIDTSLLKDLHSLEELELDINMIMELEDDIFDLLPNLKKLFLFSNQFQSIPGHIFQKNPLLEKINLGSNNLSFVPENLLWNLKHLTHFSLSKCKLKQLPPDFFRDTLNLDWLDLNKNELAYLPDTIFGTLQRLTFLDLSHNQLTTLPKKLFFNLSKLSDLKMSNNAIIMVPEELFLNTISLKSLELSENMLDSFSSETVKHIQTLHILNLSGNKIKSFPFGNFGPMYLQILNASMNHIEHIALAWNSLPNLRIIDFSYNKIKRLFLPYCMENLRKIITVSLKHNNISYIFIRNIPKHTLINSDKCVNSDLSKPEIYISSNPLNCDCTLHSLYTYLSKSEQFYSFPDQNKWTCMSPAKFRGIFFSRLEESDFLCPIEDDCPRLCRCGTRAKDNTTVLDCSSVNIEKFNASVPVNTTVLYFQNNKIKDLKDLSITTWDDIVELKLDNNLLESIEAFDLPKSLQILSVRHNHLKTISESLQNFMAAIDGFSLFVANNTWDCNCDALSLKFWLLDHSSIVRDIENITCQVEETGNKTLLPLYKIPDTYFCPEDNSHLIIYIITFGILGIVILTFVPLYYRNQQTVLAYAYIHCGWLFRCFFKNEDLDESKKFDAFVAYSSNDREVVMAIMEELENNEPFFKLCIHERDWTAGNYISENIVHSVQNSRRTIVMLSEDFISSMWFVVEVRAVLFQMFQDKFDRLIVIVIGNFPSMDTVDEDIQQLLRRKTYLEWGKRWFWERLRYSMPHHSNSQRNIPNKKRKEDRFVELVENQITFLATPVSIQRDPSLQNENL